MNRGELNWLLQTIRRRDGRAFRVAQYERGRISPVMAHVAGTRLDQSPRINSSRGASLNRETELPVAIA